MVDLEDDSDIGNRATCQSSDPASECVYGPWEVEPGDGYSLVISSLGTPDISRADFTITVDYYDGVPDNMNNASLWIGLQFRARPILAARHVPEFLRSRLLLPLLPGLVLLGSGPEESMTWRRSSPISFGRSSQSTEGRIVNDHRRPDLGFLEYGTMNDEVKKTSDQLPGGSPSAM